MSSTPISFSDSFPACIQNFKTAFSNIKPQVGSCLMLAVPFAVITFILTLVILGGSIAAGIGAADTTGDEDTAAFAMILSVILGAGLFMVVLAPFAAYFGFCSMRFTARACANPSQKFTLGSLYSYDPSLWGFIGLGCLQLFVGAMAGVVAVVVSAILFFLFGLPAYPIYFFWLAFCTCSVFSYFDSPSLGAWGALSRGWSVITKDWKRWLAMSVVAIGAFITYVVISLVVVFTIGWIPLIGQIAVSVFSLLMNFYFLFVLCSTYHDSAATVG